MNNKSKLARNERRWEKELENIINQEGLTKGREQSSVGSMPTSVKDMGE